MDPKNENINPGNQALSQDLPESPVSKLAMQPQAVQAPAQPPVLPVQPLSLNPPDSQPTSTPVGEASFPKSSGPPFSFSNIIKLFVGLIAILALFLVLFGIVLPSLKGKEKVELSYWGLFEDEGTMNKVFGEFEKQNPDIKINYQKQDIKDYRERLATRIKNGTGPDIFRFHNSWYPQASDILLPLPKETITKEQFKSIYYPVASRDLIKNGAIYGIPLEMDTLSLFVNTDLFKQAGISPPTNWNDFINAARSLTVKDQTGKIKTAGAAIGTFENISHASDLTSLLFVQDGVNLDDFGNSKQRISDALNFYTSFARDEGSVWDTSLEKDISLFSKGNLAMYFGFYWDYFNIKSQNPSLSFDVVPVPQLSTSVNVASYWAEGISSKSKHQKESLLFMKFLASKSTLDNLYQAESQSRSFGEPYPRVDYAEKLKGTPMNTFVSQGKTATSSLFASGTFDNGLNANLENALQSAINTILGGTTPDTAADSLIKATSQVTEPYFKAK